MKIIRNKQDLQDYLDSLHQAFEALAGKYRRQLKINDNMFKRIQDLENEVRKKASPYVK